MEMVYEVRLSDEKDYEKSRVWIGVVSKEPEVAVKKAIANEGLKVMGNYSRIRGVSVYDSAVDFRYVESRYQQEQY